jgi:hypothetical protein|tara:strand:- start:211 stop:369 length:159 start_codon:yes stop_codon:yes gene_type:complete
MLFTRVTWILPMREDFVILAFFRLAFRVRETGIWSTPKLKFQFAKTEISDLL